MTGYSTEYKEMIVKRMLSEDAVSVGDLVTETGVSRSTLYKWRNQYGLSQSKASKWSGEMKFAVLLETSSLNETELAAYSSLSIKVPFSIFQSFINCGINIFEFIAYLSDVRLHHCPVIFNGVKIWRIWGQIKQ